MTRRPVRRLYPAADLIALIRPVNIRALAEELGVSYRTAARMAEHGKSWSKAVADRYSCAAGYHPACVWPAWIDDALADADRKRTEKRARNAAARAVAP